MVNEANWGIAAIIPSVQNSTNPIQPENSCQDISDIYGFFHLQRPLALLYNFMPNFRKHNQRKMSQICLKYVIWEGVASTSRTSSLNSPANTILTLILTPNKTFSSGGISKSSLSKHRYCSYLPWTYQNHHPWRPTTSPRIYHRTKVCWYISRAAACPVPAITLWADILNRTNKVIMYSQVNAQS